MNKLMLMFGVGPAIIMWLGLMGCLFVQALQAWHMEGEMAAIDALQEMVVIGFPVTALCAVVGFGLCAIIEELTSED